MRIVVLLLLAASALFAQTKVVGGSAVVSGSTSCVAYTITEADLTADATTQTIDLMAVAAGTRVRITIKEDTQFGGGGVTALTASVGVSTGTVTEYAPAYALMQVPGASQYYDSSVYSLVTFAAHTVAVKFTSTTANLLAADAGLVRIWVCKETLP